MRINRPFLFAVTTCLAGVFATATIAEAQTRQRRGEPPRTLTVKKRSFLDSGRVVQVGSESGYMQASSQFNRVSDSFNARGRYGNETLPGRFELPGGRALFNF